MGMRNVELKKALEWTRDNNDSSRGNQVAFLMKTNRNHSIVDGEIFRGEWFEYASKKILMTRLKSKPEAEKKHNYIAEQ